MIAEHSEFQGIEATRVPGGLFVISERLPYLRSAALGFAYRIGSRDDPKGKEGTAHLVEHMVFKGTERLNAKSINIFVESHGAEMNGFTDKEITCFYCRFPREEIEPMVGLMQEILKAPAFAQEELDKEKGVVSEEIRTNEEDPETCAVNLLMKAIYGEESLGRPVLGTVNSIARLNRDDLQRFYQAFYGAKSGVVAAAGDIEHQRLVAMLDKFDPPGAQALIRGKLPLMPFRALTQVRKDISQVYVCLAWPTFPYKDPRRYALSVLNTALGGGVSSRLFQRLREEEGLVYSIGSFVEGYEDTGVLGIYFVAEAQKFLRCITVLREEIALLRQERVKMEEFERARSMTKSAVVLAMESSTSRMLRLARSYLLLDRVTGIDETVQAYNSLKVGDVIELIDLLLSEDRFYAGVVGPLTEEEVTKVIGVERSS
ncbi:MAG: pitrilysin family protein [candidate division WOR-3 bacterium]